MPAGWAPQALEAQAVAARTYAITTDVAGGFYNLYPDTRSQMYRGIAAETPSTDAAVAATRGQIVTYNGAPAVTYFFASSGGYTENVEDAWPGATPDPWLRGVPDPYDGAAGDPYDHWTRQLSIAAATARLGRLLNGKLVGIRVTQTGASPRIMSAQVIGTAGTTTVTGQQLQSAFGLLSTWAAFTTMSSSVQAPETGAVHPGSDIEILAQVKRLFGMMAGARPVLTGTIVPARAGATAVIELRAASGWRKLGRVRVGKGGAFAVRTPRAGTYRAVYRGLDGPTVNVG
jgi:stage II sporulation protein D